MNLPRDDNAKTSASERLLLRLPEKQRFGKWERNAIPAIFRHKVGYWSCFSVVGGECDDETKGYFGLQRFL